MIKLTDLYLEYISPKHMPAFKAWFKNSVVVDDKGEPLVVYHGTAADFSEFKVGWTRGLFFSKDLEQAHRFSDGDLKRGDTSSIMPVYLSIQKPYYIGITKDQAMVDEYYTKYFIDRPWITKKSQRSIWKGRMERFDYSDLYSLGSVIGEEGRDILLKYGYDGIIAPRANDGTAYIVFSPKQIKSATGNIGQYHGDVDDITK